MELVQWTRGIYFEDADPLALVLGDGELPMDQKGRRKFEIYKVSDNSVVIFKVL